MRRSERRFLAFGFALAALVFVLGLLNGCASAPPSVQCFKTVQGIAQTVDTSMNVAGDLYRDGKITDAQKAQILDAYAKYQKAAHVAIDGCQVVQDKDSADKLPQDVGQLAADLVRLIASFKKG